MKSQIAPRSSGQFLVQKYLFWTNREMKGKINMAYLEHTEVAGVVLEISHENETVKIVDCVSDASSTLHATVSI
jgi:hypothetical protein